MRESLSNQLLAGKSEPRERQFAHCAMLEEVIVRDGIYPFEYLSSVVGSSIFSCQSASGEKSCRYV